MLIDESIKVIIKLVDINFGTDLFIKKTSYARVQKFFTLRSFCLKIFFKNYYRLQNECFRQKFFQNKTSFKFHLIRKSVIDAIEEFAVKGKASILINFG